jgi:uncharacterized tellurite resistance protein B-like protein
VDGLLCPSPLAARGAAGHIAGNELHVLAPIPEHYRHIVLCMLTAPLYPVGQATENGRTWHVIESFKQFFTDRMAPARRHNGSAASTDADALEAERHQLHVAACALLLEIAYADDEFSDSERHHICAVLQRHFDLDEETANALIEIAEAERNHAIDLYQFTSLIRQHYDLGQKTLLAEIMWGVVLTDGEVARHEGYMLRKIANLLALEPGYLAAARNRASRAL